MHDSIFQYSNVTKYISLNIYVIYITMHVFPPLGIHDSTIDLLVAGVEVSLWVAEQWAADLKTILPQLRVATTSSNKLLDIDNNDPKKVCKLTLL